MKLHGSYYDDDLVSALQGVISRSDDIVRKEEAQVTGHIAGATGFASRPSR
jgi:hypothetical protein